MNEVKAKELLRKYADGNCTEDEKLLFEQWYLNLNRTNHAQLTETELEQAEREMGLTLAISPAVKTKSLWPYYSAAATVLLCLGIVFFFNKSNRLLTDEKREAAIALNEIKPGKNTATLTLSNGKSITLSDVKSGVVIDASKLTYNDGSVVTNNNDRQNSTTPSYSGQLKASTPRGGTYQIILPDGTKVWLNASSELKFPASFNQSKQRSVELSGEAYFEVAKNKMKPFMVRSNGQEIEVLGTHFNVNSYLDEKVAKTTLLEGAVKISQLKGNNPASYVLRPGQQAIAGNTIVIKNVDAMDAIDWKNGMFIFNKESLESIMRKLSRWYDVDVVFEDEKLKSKLLGGTVSRFSTVTEVLEVLELTELAHFKIKGRSIMVME
ncbi:FecR family protein [Pedobacter nyackensis]|uniref:FecR family protein n=1 Tax=Pedobacter nyackensis TaxID=475255 RepID=UPI00292F0BE3|nr:FecR family protein [Pedobacter nyackensis]